MMKLKVIVIFCLFCTLFSCSDDPEMSNPSPDNDPDVTIFFVNDNHGRINNFSKVKAIVDEAKANGNALLVSSGDIFAGNPIVDQYVEQGFPMIDIMNQAGFDIGVLGNHEFDYGTEVLKDRIDQSNFPWILANVDASQSAIDQPDPFLTLSVGGFRITFLGLIETNGKQNDIIPSTHPLRVADLSFQRYQDVAGSFTDLKAQENADVFVGLTHLGSGGDRNLASNFPFFDLIIGGHSHENINERVNGIPIFQAGSNLQFMGRIDLFIEDQTVVDYSYRRINLNAATESDAGLVTAIDAYNDDPSFTTVVGQSNFDHQRFDAGCFFTTGLKEFMEVDFTIQNLGGIRAGIDQGPITRLEIFTMDPFNNQSVAFTKTVGEFESFFCATGSRFYFSGINVSDGGGDFQIVDENGLPLPDDRELTMGVNDFIPAVYDTFFDFEDADIRSYTTAEAILGYLQNINSTIDFEGCVNVLECD